MTSMGDPILGEIRGGGMPTPGKVIEEAGSEVEEKRELEDKSPFPLFFRFFIA